MFFIDQYSLNVYQSAPSISIYYNYTPVIFATECQALREACIIAVILGSPQY